MSLHSKRHYEEVAKMLASTLSSVAGNPKASSAGTVMLIAEKLARIYAHGNRSFDRKRWRAAVGYDMFGED